MKTKTCFFLFIFFPFFILNDALAQSQYHVLEGDTLWEIALNHQMSLEKIIKSNPQIQNPNLIFPGQAINIPNQSSSLENHMELTENEVDLLEAINRKRFQMGLNPLQIDRSLTEAARLKAMDMKENEYVSHTSPTYGNPTIMLKQLQISFREVNENIGAGHQTVDQVFSTWMNSSSNRANVLSEKATHIGIGYVDGGLHGHYWTIFIIEK